MKIADYYRAVVLSYGLGVDDEDNILSSSGEDASPLLSKGLPMVIPTREQVKNSLKLVDGVYKSTKVLFNPLKEDVLVGESVSMTKLRKVVTLNMGMSIINIGRLLLMLGTDTSKSSRMPMLIKNLYISVGQEATKSGKTVYDSRMVGNWDKVCGRAIAENKLLKIVAKKRGVIDDVTYQITTSLSATLLKNIDKCDIRVKDKKVFKALLKFLLPNLNERGVVSYGSKDKRSPRFITLTTLWLEIIGYHQRLLSKLEGIDQETYDMSLLNMSVDLDGLEDLSLYSRELGLIPDLTKGVKTNELKTNELKRREWRDDTQPVTPTSNNGVGNTGLSYTERLLRNITGGGGLNRPNPNLYTPEVNTVTQSRGLYQTSLPTARVNDFSNQLGVGEALTESVAERYLAQRNRCAPNNNLPPINY